MIINNNIPAMNTHRQMGINQGNMQSSMEKLSSGMRINKAGDDAAGLAISEKMRAQINGLDQASRNAQDGISLIQTGEGALDETHSILQRMRELAVQSSNDTNVGVDRDEIQKEVNQLSAEITRIAETTEFNTQNLLGGEFEGKFQIGANSDQNIELAISDMGANSLGVAGTEAAGFEQTKAITAGTDTSFSDGTYQVMAVDDYNNSDGEALDSTNDDLYSGATGTHAAVQHVMVNDKGDAVGTSEDGLTFDSFDNSTTNTSAATTTFTDTPSEITVDGAEATGNIAIEAYDEDDNPTGHKLDTGTYEMVDISNHATYTGHDVALADANGDIVALGETGTGTAGTAATTESWVDVDDTNNQLLQHNANTDFEIGSEIKVSGAGIDVSSQESANDAITTINNAIESVSSQRSELGSFQNRLEHTISNLDNSSENLSAAESRIRDVDMAKEMMEMTKANVLSQASQSMLAQANQQPQSVLQLLG